MGYFIQDKITYIAQQEVFHSELNNLYGAAGVFHSELNNLYRTAKVFHSELNNLYRTAKVFHSGLNNLYRKSLINKLVPIIIIYQLLILQIIIRAYAV